MSLLIVIGTASMAVFILQQTSVQRSSAKYIISQLVTNCLERTEPFPKIYIDERGEANISFFLVLKFRFY